MCADAGSSTKHDALAIFARRRPSWSNGPIKPSNFGERNWGMVDLDFHCNFSVEGEMECVLMPVPPPSMMR